MLKRLLLAPIKSALAPLFIALSIFRKIKTAILKLVGGSRKAANAAAGATSTARETAETVTNERSESPTDQQDVHREQSPSEETRHTSVESEQAFLDADAEHQFSRFKTYYAAYTGYSFFVPILFIVSVGALEYISLGDLLVSSFQVALLPGIFAGIARVRKKVTWGIAFGFAVIFTLGSFVSFIGILPTFGVFVGESPGFDQPLLFLITLGQFGLLGGILRAGWKGRHAAFDPGSVDQAARATESTTPVDRTEPTSSSEPTSVNDQKVSASADTQSETDTVSTASSAPNGTVEPDTSVDATTATQATTETATATDSPPEDRESSETHPTEESSSGAAQSKDERDSPSLEARLSDLENDELTASEIRELGEDLQSEEVPDQAFTLLEHHATADDPEIRLAVCDVCVDIDDERADEILRGRRIDTDNRVMNAAIEGLS